jgi:hypothetical protein
LWVSIVLGHFLAITEIPFVAADWVVGLSFLALPIMVLVILIYLLGGSFIDALCFHDSGHTGFRSGRARMGYDAIWLVRQRSVYCR